MKWHTLSLWLIWSIGPPLEGLILVRSLIVGWFRKCPFFSVYLTSVFIQDVLLLAVYIFKFKYYPPLYWYAEFFRETWALTFVELDRNLRALQALSLIVLVLLVTYYRIPLGRYAKGIFAGYGIFIAAVVLTLTLRTLIGQAFQETWVFVQPVSYAAALGTWCHSLWAEEPPPKVESPARIEQDYQLLALLTRKGLLEAREFLGKAMRP